MCCSDGSKSLTVNSIADRTDCGTWGVGDKVSCLPFRSRLVVVTVGGTASSPVPSSSVRRSSDTGTATFVLGLSGEFGSALLWRAYWQLYFQSFMGLYHFNARSVQ